MKKPRLRAAAILMAAVLFLSLPVSAAPSVSARSALLMDAATGRVLYEKDADRQSLIASTTKIMTGLLTAESGRLSETVCVPPEAVGIEGSSLYLKEGERLTVEQLLYGLMLQSGNDAAVALAVTLAGSVEEFVTRMNQRAAELGLSCTHFANPNGLDDDGNYATARDLGRLAAAALQNETFRQVVSTKEYSFGDRHLTNHNKLLWRYDGAVGVKTGYTKAAGRLLVSAAERCGRQLIAVTINAPDDWNDHAAMLDYGFSQMTTENLLSDGAALGVVPVIGGTAALCRCSVKGDITCGLLPWEQLELTVLLPRFVFAPVTAGTHAGWVEARIDGAVVGRAELVWENGAAVLPEKEPRNLWERLFGG